MGNDISWSMTRTTDKLRVSYRFENKSDKVVYVNDGLVVQLPAGFHRTVNVAAATTDAPDTAVIRVGRPTGDVPAATVPQGFYVAVPAGEAFEGSREIAFPFSRKDAMGRQVKLPTTIDKASFVLEAFDGEPPRWLELKGDDGNPIRVPDGQGMRQLTGAVQSIPSA